MQYEREVLCEDEMHQRHVIMNEMTTQVTFPIQQMTLRLREVHARQAIRTAERINRKVQITNIFKRNVMLAVAIQEKRNLQNIEMLC